MIGVNHRQVDVFQSQKFVLVVISDTLFCVPGPSTLGLWTCKAMCSCVCLMSCLIFHQI